MTQEGIPNLTDCQPCVLVEVRVFSDKQCFLDFSWPVSLFISQHNAFVKVYGSSTIGCSAGADLDGCRSLQCYQ